jgi:predicted RNase H-like nuclease
MPRIARGLDGCADGWVVVTLVEGRVGDVEVVAGLHAVPDDGATVAVDMPIGLVDAPVRDADAAARRRLPGRGSTLFNSPPRAVVDGYLAGAIRDHATASARARAVTGKGLSRQTWALVPRIAELDLAVGEGRKLLEVHPEVAFTEATGQVPPRKRSWAGVATRLRALEGLGLVLPGRFHGDRCAPDDVLDAAICAWVADGVACGDGRIVTYPGDPTQQDPRHPRRPLAIVARGQPVARTSEHP